MPKGDRAILKADPEDGTTPIANLLLEALAVARLTGREKGFVLYLWRETYGWVKDGKRLKEKAISLDKWAEAFTMRRTHVSATLSTLCEKHVLIRTFSGAGKGYIYTMNTRVSEWCNSYHPGEQLPETVTVTENGNALGIKEGGYQEREQLPSGGTEQLPSTVTPPDTTPGTPKESIKENTLLIDPKVIKERSGKSKGKPIKQKFGEFGNVFLTAGEYEKLVNKFGEKGAADWVEELSSGKAKKGYHYDNDYAAILTWARRDEKQGQPRAGPHPGPHPRCSEDPNKYIQGRYGHMVHTGLGLTEIGRLEEEGHGRQKGGTNERS